MSLYLAEEQDADLARAAIAAEDERYLGEGEPEEPTEDEARAIEEAFRDVRRGWGAL